MAEVGKKLGGLCCGWDIHAQLLLSPRPSRQNQRGGNVEEEWGEADSGLGGDAHTGAWCTTKF